MTLYEINEAIRNFELNIDEETGELLNADELDALELEKEVKIENIALWIKDLNAEADAIKAEEKNLKQRREATENKAEQLKKYLVYALNGDKFKTSKVSISYRKSESVEVYDEDAIPRDYLTEKVTYSVDKTMLKSLLKAGQELDGVRLVEKNNIQVK